MKSALTALVFFLSFWLPACSQAMTLERVGNDLYATGPTVDGDFLSFKEALAKGGVRRLVLVNAPGGDLWTGMRVARMVQEAQIKTVVSGFCMSACSLIFIAGQERAFGTGHLPKGTLVGIHGAHSQDTKQVLHQAMPQMYALYKQQMGEKFDAAVINQALYDIKEGSGMLRIRELQRNQEKDRTPWFCPTGQTPFEQCQQHPGKDAFTLGLVTQTETETLTLPDSMRLQLGFFGRPLGPPIADMTAHAAQLIDDQCAGQLRCKTIGDRTLQNYLAAKQHKAVAIGWGQTGFGINWERDDPGQAMLKALYNCNHAKNNPKLCRLAAVNDHMLLPFYEEEQAQTAGLLKTLKAPAPEVIQKEREEPGAGTPTTLRTGQQVSGMTPKALEGIQRWDTAMLAQALTQTDRPVLIDAAAAGPMLPGALSLMHSGLAFEDAKMDADYADRFRQMLLAAAPSLNQPVVFYCASSACWLSVNAAMRARQMGYTQVIWYRGGLLAWTQAGMPTVGRVPVAVLY
jgi:rhodanese-related sulfurtransferase